MTVCFPPDIGTAESRLTAFASMAGAAYAQRRNFDLESTQTVSMLSPYLRAKALDEIAVARSILRHHDEKAAEKFLMELFWRTYWKGWLEQRPAVWTQYQTDLKRLQNDLQTQSGLRRTWQSACKGETGIDGFDHWARELVETGYLHNHARMWFASIWVFTLRLPWQLGADFFLRHLLDGDTAVNTLSWRWVSGIQTRGKTYLATRENISKFTGNRFAPQGLATTALPISAPEPPTPADIRALAPLEPSARMGLLLHEDDIKPDHLKDMDFAATAWLETPHEHSPWHRAPNIAQFRGSLAQSAAGSPLISLSTEADVLGWMKAHQVTQIVTPFAPVGPVAEHLTGLSALPITQMRRPLDSAAWPLATKGFFAFRKHISDLIKAFVI